MSHASIQDILPLVQTPSRYLGSEFNRTRKSWKKTRLHVALAFPDLYEIATSHFGIQILYDLLNAQKDTLAERVFAPAIDMEDQLRNRNMTLCSLESQKPLNQFDIVGFSLLYELNYTNMVNMLDLGGIAFISSQRNKQDPFVIAGGPCTCNPEPVADFFDAIVVGDGEAVILEMTHAWKKWQDSKNGGRRALLRRWSTIKGVYVPAFFDVDHVDGESRSTTPQTADHPRIQRAVLADLDAAPMPLKPIVPFGKPVHDRLRMEIARGCTRGCRFCQAGMIYRPVRERRPQTVLASVNQSLKETGYEDLSLLSLSTGDYSCITPLMKSIMEFGEKDRLAVSLPSLRAGTLSPEMMALIQKVRKTGFTIAPEAGSQRLRDVINKNISEADIIETVKHAFAMGWKLIKLYFMIGLPTETQADVEAIAGLVQRIKSVVTQTGRPARVNVSVATFVPKPHTPFQWEPQISLEMALQKIKWLKAHLKGPGIQFKWQDPRMSVIEGVWARGDRKLGAALIKAWQSGCRFDGWMDYFDYARWTNVFDASGIDPQEYIGGKQDPFQSLPWDHIDIGVSRAFLRKERERAIAGKITDDCRNGECSGCGVCDFDRLQPVVFHDLQSTPTPAGQEVKQKPSTGVHKYLVRFKKMGRTRFLAHLEMVKIFIRSLRRTDMPLKYSNGFHPMPRVSFGDTLPMGMQSENETMVLVLTEAVDPEKMIARLQPQLPNGLEICSVSPYDGDNTTNQNPYQSYHVQLRDGFLNQSDLDGFFEQQSVIIERKNKKGKRVFVDLKKAIGDIQLLNSRHVQMSLGRHNNLMIRPALVLKALFHLTEPQILTAIITKK